MATTKYEPNSKVLAYTLKEIKKARQKGVKEFYIFTVGSECKFVDAIEASKYVERVFYDDLFDEPLRNSEQYKKLYGWIKRQDLTIGQGYIAVLKDL